MQTFLTVSLITHRNWKGDKIPCNPSFLLNQASYMILIIASVKSLMAGLKHQDSIVMIEDKVPHTMKHFHTMPICFSISDKYHGIFLSGGYILVKSFTIKLQVKCINKQKLKSREMSTLPLEKDFSCCYYGISRHELYVRYFRGHLAAVCRFSQHETCFTQKPTFWKRSKTHEWVDSSLYINFSVILTWISIDINGKPNKHLLLSSNVDVYMVFFLR